jgi:hypothetical protein
VVIRNSKHELHGVGSSSEAAPRRRGFAAQMNVIGSQRDIEKSMANQLMHATLKIKKAPRVSSKCLI